jgi:hypothetical protein
MTSQFKHLEGAFLVDGDLDAESEVAARERRRKGGSAAYVEEGWNEAEDDHANHYEPSYRKCGMRERWLWVLKKSAFKSLMDGVAKLETRRTAMQMTAFSM